MRQASANHCCVLLLVILSVASSCTMSGGRSGRADTTPGVPATLADHNGNAGSLLTKREDGNIMESLYEEVLAKDQNLKELVRYLDALQASKNDSLHSLLHYQRKNSEYYKGAFYGLTAIKDTLVRERLRILLQRSKASYETLGKPLNQLQVSIEKNDSLISDLKLAIKISKTLAVMEQYQREQLPKHKPLQDFLRRQEKGIRDARTIFH